MNFLEKNLEDIIYETPNDLLLERGLFIFGTKKRQLNLGNYGKSDLVTFYRVDGVLVINIFELKKDKVSASTFFQALRYAKAISFYLKSRGFKHKFRFKFMLVGSSIDKDGDFCYMPDLFNNVHLWTYQYQFDGIFFNQHNGYKLINSGFKGIEELSNELPIPF